METSTKRLLSLDILRGLTIILMIIVNDPGSWSHVYAPLLHVEWNGITPTDYVFPTFLFIVGVSIVLSLNKQTEKGKSRLELTKKIVLRSIKIYLVGIFLWLWPSFNFEGIRVYRKRLRARFSQGSRNCSLASPIQRVSPHRADSRCLLAA